MKRETEERLEYACRLGGSIILMGIVAQSLDILVEASQLESDFISQTFSKVYQITATGMKGFAGYTTILGTKNLITIDIQ